MRIVNNMALTRRKTCDCGAVLEFTSDDIKHVGDTFRGEYEDYIVCPNCKRAIVLRSGSYCSRPYD